MLRQYICAERKGSIMRKILLTVTLCFCLLVGCTSNNTADNVTESLLNSTPEPFSTLTQQPEPNESDDSRDPTSKTIQTLLPADIVQEVNGIEVKISPMIELLTIVQYLSDYDKLTNVNTSYNTDIDNAFQSYKDHEAVKFFKEHMDAFDFEKPPTACLYLDKDFSIYDEYNESFFSTYNPISMEKFSNLLKKFCADSNFNSFFDSHTNFYIQMLSSYVEMLPNWNMIQALETYYGKKMQSYTIILSPLSSGGCGPTLDNDRLYCIIGPTNANDDTPLFGNKVTILNFIFHEFGHSFVPVADFNNSFMVEETKRSQSLMEPIKKEMELLDYRQWSVVYEELILRAVVIDLCMQHTDILSLENGLYDERIQGFLYIDDVYQLLQEYNKKRDIYPVFDSFVPKITDYLLEQHHQ